MVCSLRLLPSQIKQCNNPQEDLKTIKNLASAVQVAKIVDLEYAQLLDMGKWGSKD